MSVWLAVAVISALAGVWLARGFLRRGDLELAEGEEAISVYRDQIDAVARDAEQGLISEAERRAAEREIEARALRAARELDNGLLASRVSRPAAIGLVLVTMAGSGALYGVLGAPGMPDQPLAGRHEPLPAQRVPTDRPAAGPEVGGGDRGVAPKAFARWWTVARERTARGDYASAAEAYRGAAAASGNRPSVLSAYAEALTLANGNKVPPEAKDLFARVLTYRPRDPRARYYLALAKAQEQDFAAALDDWVALYRESGPDAPWAATVRRDIVNMARFTRTPIDKVLADASEAEIAFAAAPLGQRPSGGGPADPDLAAAGGQQGGGLTASMVADLAARLESEPDDLRGWLMLIRSYAVLQDIEQARAAAETAYEHFSARPDEREAIRSTAAELGISLM